MSEEIKFINENTQWVHVNMTSTHSGNKSESVREEFTKIFVGDGESVEEKRMLLKNRVLEYMCTWYDVGYETIYAD